MELPERNVFVQRVEPAAYELCPEVSFPELDPRFEVSTTLIGLRELFRAAGLDAANGESRDWNPLGALVRPGDKVVLKPNWVHHENQSGAGLECLVTQTSLIEALLVYLTKVGSIEVAVCDAPIQGCDFSELSNHLGLERLEERFQNCFAAFRFVDLRRTILPGGRLGAATVSETRPLAEYALFDLAEKSLLEPVSSNRRDFRVTMYDPELLQRTHRPGVHQYLVARDVLGADVVFNLPKLKTHAKAGITGALKNMVGMNGHKEFLCHHRKGGTANGGDNYPGRSLTKSLAENLLDMANHTRNNTLKRWLAASVDFLLRARGAVGADMNIEGAWHGNDTVWRMALDLQHILHHGTTSGDLQDNVMRRVVTITDAIVAGEGNGPLAPTPRPLGLLTMAGNTAAAEYVHALLMGFLPERVPIVREAFEGRSWSVAGFSPDEIQVVLDGVKVEADRLGSKVGQRFEAPAGWRGHCEAPGGAPGGSRP